jgi:hypothetical protein
VQIELKRKFHQKRIEKQSGPAGLLGLHWRRFMPQLSCRKTQLWRSLGRLENWLRLVCLQAFSSSEREGNGRYNTWSQVAHCPPSGLKVRYSVRRCRRPSVCVFCYGRRLVDLYDRVRAHFERHPQGGIVVLRDSQWLPELDSQSYRRQATVAALRLRKKLKRVVEREVGGCFLRVLVPRQGGFEARTYAVAAVPDRGAMPFRVRAPNAALPASASLRQTALFLLRWLPYPRRLLLGDCDETCLSSTASVWRRRLAPGMPRSLVFFGEWTTLGGDRSEA